MPILYISGVLSLFMKLSHNKMDCISQLPDCILSHILTMLPMKDLLKTSVLSRRWCRLWALRRDLYFDIHNVLGSEMELLETGDLIELPRDSTVVCFADFDLSRDEFVNRVDQFVKNFEGTKIDSFLVNFYLDCEHSNNIDQWISFVIARGVERIDLLFLGRPYAHLSPSPKRYKFSFDLFSKTNASTLKHLHLQNCLVCHITNCDFILFKNLRSLTLGSTKVDELFITSLVSNLELLDELHLIYCEFKSSMPKIVSSSLCYLEVKNCHVVSNNIKMGVNLCSLDCLKLTSLEYFGPCLETFYINTPMLKRIRIPVISDEYVNAFTLLSTLTELYILQLDIYSMVSRNVLEQRVLFIFLSF